VFVYVIFAQLKYRPTIYFIACRSLAYCFSRGGHAYRLSVELTEFGFYDELMTIVMMTMMLCIYVNYIIIHFYINEDAMNRNKWRKMIRDD